MADLTAARRLLLTVLILSGAFGGRDGGGGRECFALQSGGGRASRRNFGAASHAGGHPQKRVAPPQTTGRNDGRSVPSGGVSIAPPDAEAENRGAASSQRQRQQRRNQDGKRYSSAKSDENDGRRRKPRRGGKQYGRRKSPRSSAERATVQFNQKLSRIAKSRDVDAPARIERLVFEAVEGIERDPPIGRNAASSAEHLEEGAPGVVADAVSFNILIGAYARRGGREAARKAEAILEEMFRLSLGIGGCVRLRPDAYSFSGVLNALSRSGERDAPDRALALLSRMDAGEGTCDGPQAATPSTITPNAVHYNCVLDALAKAGRATEAESLLREMEGRFLLTGGRTEERETFHGSRRRSNGSATAFVVGAISYNCVIRAWANYRHDGAIHSNVIDAPARAEAVLQRMIRLAETGRNPAARPDIISYTSVISAHSKSGRPDGADRAEEILRGMLGTDAEGDAAVEVVRPDVVTWGAVIGAHARRPGGGTGAKRAAALLEEMDRRHREDNKCAAPNIIIVNSVLSAFARSGELDAPQRALELLRRVQDTGRVCSRSAGAIASAMAAAPTMRLRPDAVSYSTVIDAFAKSGGSPLEAEGLLRLMGALYDETGDESVRPNEITYGSIINCWVKSGRPDAPLRAEALLDEMGNNDREGHRLQPNAMIYGSCMECWARSRRRDAAARAEDLLSRMRKAYAEGNENARPDAATVGYLINAWTKSGDTHAMGRAEELLEELEGAYCESGKRESALRPTSLVYSAVLQACAKNGTAEGALRAERLLERIKASHEVGEGDRIKLTTAQMNAVIDAHARSGEASAAERAEEILRDMLRMTEGGDTDVRVTTRTFNAALLAWKNSNGPKAPERAEALLKLMNERYKRGNLDAKPDTVTLNTVIAAWAKDSSPRGAERAEAFLQFAEKMHALGDESLKPDLISFNACLDAWANSQDVRAPRKAEALLQRMQKYSGVRPDVATVRSFIKANKSAHRSPTITTKGGGAKKKGGRQYQQWHIGVLALKAASAAKSELPFRHSHAMRGAAGGGVETAQRMLSALVSEYKNGRVDASTLRLSFDVLIDAWSKQSSGLQSEVKIKELLVQRQELFQLASH